MKYLQLSVETEHILPFYLAMEEYATRYAGRDDVFFMWQVSPTVIFGRNQLIDKEVNLDYCERNGIAVYRRKSGGGCVFADKSNIMLSYITCGDNVEAAYSRYTTAVVSMLRSLGLDATANGRNDILVGGLKVSGNAFYRTSGCSIVHGTMLYDTDMTHMMSAITPSTLKLESKGVESVRSRITTLNRHLDIGIEQFKVVARARLTDGTIELSGGEEAEIERIMQGYLAPEFIYGHNPRCNKRCGARIDGVGEVNVHLELNHNVIRRVNLVGDFFVTGDVDRDIVARLIGVNCTRDALMEALSGVDCATVIRNLTNEKIINLIIQ